MGLATFKGGIHPYEGKELSENKPVQVLQPKGEMVFPLSQHIGAPAKPLVAAGDQVLVGQKIGEPGGFISACVISSVSGTVKTIEPRLVANGSMVQSVIIENDGKYQTVEGFGKERDPKSLSKEEIRNLVKEAGVVGLGGAGFPSHVKLTPKDESKIDTVIVNGAECEPYLTSDYRMMLEEPESIIKGLTIILQLFDNAKGVIAIESNKPEAIKQMTELVKDEPRITVCPLQTKYPQGGERTLIYAVTGRKINSTMLPADAGCMVDNVDTVISIYNAVAKSIPLIRRIITVTGDAIANPQNYNVRIGTSYTELLEASGGFQAEPAKVISGGPMMGQALFDYNVPVTKTSSALTCLTKDEVAEHAPSACIRCGRCVKVCPGNIVPQMIMEAAERSDMERFIKLNGMECCECGCCAYICPARRPLTQAFKEMRKEVAASRKKA
ncbi:electron transport complex subunit RsxC [Lacrimispora saccharolytica]|uniref:Ion-translocating oxidoreductase complex subunit C n=1 Tax=Lacrimispora saccharolytica (strain ATCC 35040 / DSM 2544 / NRCC 2533 / WM1) TaxID=610130 RepID=D9RAG3_LACSW|nr:electron transport complex subunit RsxC [Lacrimispora saccharolytica]ADL04241.1 electron transport complex, RnfABCDGE type, C subunit [[Clostridium] saccharolyticum WM1]QRV21480.1 electron transport complex subunit RsxC [Lacrimispora saccharolytica]